MYINFLRLITSCFLLLTALQARTALAAAPVVHITARPAWLNATKAYNKKIPLRNIENGYFYQLVEQQIHVENQADYHHIITEIVSEAGIQNASQFL